MKNVYGQNPIGLFSHSQDVGSCELEGSASFDKREQTYTITGAGTNMWFANDEFHYLWTTLQGDFILRAEVAFIGEGAHPHRKAGWILRNSLKSDSKHVNASVHGDGLTSLQYRRAVADSTREVTSSDQAPDVIQLERRENTYIMSTAKFGQEFTSITLQDVELDKEVYAGLYVCSHTPDVLESAVFRNVRIIIPMRSEYTPYEDYLGSNLEVLDVTSGHRKIIHRSAHSLQAPNWTTDGEKLLYNSKGHLYTYELATDKIAPLNTGFALSNNNDHVITFDGKLLGISHHDPDDDDHSALYYLPIEGDSTPTRVTKPGVGASYLHGWSADNKKMIFTGQRNGVFDIYTVALENGKEQQLTDQETLDDGPEYSPDGKHIFFNSARTGKMQLWRMKADGSEQTQLTFDDYNDWFPHVSPDQKWIAFISFPKDIDSQAHPFYKHCLLRLMPYEGGEPKIIAYIYGGQGTINVPSWSPDSKKIAFVTNSD